MTNIGWFKSNRNICKTHFHQNERDRGVNAVTFLLTLKKYAMRKGNCLEI